MTTLVVPTVDNFLQDTCLNCRALKEGIGAAGIRLVFENCLQ